MSDHFISIDRQNDGMKASDFTVATSSTSGDDIELRIADLDGSGVAITRLDVIKALDAFKRALLSGKILISTFPPI